MEIRSTNKRTCLRDPIPEIYDAARFLDAAVSAFLRSEVRLADELIRLADIPSISEWTESLWGKGGPWTRPLPVENQTPLIPRDQRLPTRMPTADVKKELLKRDGFHCRFCGIPLIRQEMRSSIRKVFPEALRWGERNVQQHAAFQAMWLQYDHLAPFSRGGTNDVSNIVVACAPCNNGRSHLSLEEAGLDDPRTREPLHSAWDGLERFKPVQNLG